MSVSVDPDEAILLAALEQFALTGVRRTSTDDIARRAGVNRATLYRRLGTKDEIVGAAYLFEAARVLAGIESAIAGIVDLDEYIATFFIATLRGVRENRLLAQLLLVDREETVRALTAGAGGVLELASAFLVEKIEGIRERHGAAEGREPELGDVEALAGMLARLTQSLLLTPDGPPRVDTDVQMREFARTLLAPMIKGC
ncbi:TetR/AcrR family transcriptional regulator [Tomitella biformata]|uniref:TetR/AcrR family transcriptional regulator n=1 Tax=Tomitella biformata TaxID=630403 RepID=UPI00046501B7|nr:TetR/AcrR family transcriptional regulator [Tomitella biformata]